jgi:hypothetical protein
MPGNITPTAVRVVERDSADLARYWRAFDADAPVWIGRWAYVVAIQPRADGAFDVEFRDVK